MIAYGVHYNGCLVGGLVVVTFGLENERRRVCCNLRVGKSRWIFMVILRPYFGLQFTLTASTSAQRAGSSSSVKK